MCEYNLAKQRDKCDRSTDRRLQSRDYTTPVQPSSSPTTSSSEEARDKTIWLKIEIKCMAMNHLISTDLW